MSLFGADGANQAIGNIASSIIGAWSANSVTKKSYKYQAQLMREQQAWLEHMSNTAHQREVQDLRDAGLNPILSATGGSGASTPGSPGAGTVDVQDPAQAATQIFSARSAVKNDNARVKNETALKDSQEKLNTSQSNLSNQQATQQKMQNEFTPKLQQEQLNLLKAQQAQAIAGANSSQASANATNSLLIHQINSLKANTSQASTSAKSAQRDFDLQNQWDIKHPELKNWATGFRRFGIGVSVSANKGFK